MLGPFRTQPVEEWPDLLADARDAVPTHFDEEIFLERWPTLVAGRLDSRPPLSRRQDERIVARYAGQPPKRIPRQVRLATQLAADIYAGSYNPSGDFADQSHYIRECRAMTGRTPAYWVRSHAAPQTQPIGGSRLSERSSVQYRCGRSGAWRMQRPSVRSLVALFV